MDTLLFYFPQNSYRKAFRGVAECYAFSCFHDNVGLRYRYMPVRMIFGSINVCPFELLKRCNFFVYNYSCPLTE